MPQPQESLSLIVCTYRRPAAVRRLLESLNAQTAPPEEILVIDGSEDTETEAVARQIESSGRPAAVSYFRVPPHDRGLTRQRNYGIARARGDIIAFLDDDTVPEPAYFEEIRLCFRRHPEAGGVGGYIAGPRWWRVDPDARLPVGVFRWGEWERREDYRWRVRKLLHLDGDSSPGWMPSSGHGRSVTFLPPDGNDHQVEFMFGGASAWRREVFECCAFSTYFQGYGLYEDLSFSLQVSRIAPLYICTAARLVHRHDTDGRPNPFRYGRMVVRNGWHVWRQRWPHPSAEDRLQWWSITLLLTLCRFVDGRQGGLRRGIEEALGRMVGGISIATEASRTSSFAFKLYERNE
jgi:GT2 family glycosyltransferase